MVVRYGFRDCSSLELPPIYFPHLEIVKIALAKALQKPCTVGRGKSCGLKHQLFETGSLDSMSLLTWKELSWVTVMNQCQFIILCDCCSLKRKLQEKVLAKKQGLSHFWFCV